MGVFAGEGGSSVPNKKRTFAISGGKKSKSKKAPAKASGITYVSHRCDA